MDAAVWIEAVGMVACHITGLPDIDEIREVGEATHFCNKDFLIFFHHIDITTLPNITKLYSRSLS